MTDTTKFITLLDTARIELERRLGAIEADVRHDNHELSKDSEEQATEMQNNEVVDALGNEAREELSLIRQAYQRIEDGSYFDCQRCGDPIATARLESIPHTPYCLKCASELETLD